MTKIRSALKRSTLPPLDFIQRWVSRIVWGAWLVDFLFWELTGTLKYTPWRTLSETAWDTEARYPGERSLLEAFLLGLVVHIRYRTTLRSSVAWALQNESRFDGFVGTLPRG